MHQKNFKLFICGLVFLVGTSGSAGISTTFKNRQWEFLEYKFISKPQELTKKCDAGVIVSWLAGVCLGTIGLSSMESDFMMADQQNRKLKYCSAGFLGFFIGHIAYRVHLRPHGILQVCIVCILANLRPIF